MNVLRLAAAATACFLALSAVAPFAYACTPDWIPVLVCSWTPVSTFFGFMFFDLGCYWEGIDINNCGSSGIVSEDLVSTLLHTALDSIPSLPHAL